MAQTLEQIMEFDHVIQVHSNGTITDDVSIHAPELHVDTDGDGQILAEHEKALLADARRQGWELLTGFTAQDSYHGAMFHNSEYIGGRVETHIRETPGYWVALVAYTDEDGEDNTAGWLLAHRAA